MEERCDSCSRPAKEDDDGFWHGPFWECSACNEDRTLKSVAETPSQPEQPAASRAGSDLGPFLLDEDARNDRSFEPLLEVRYQELVAAAAADAEEETGPPSPDERKRLDGRRFQLLSDARSSYVGWTTVYGRPSDAQRQRHMFDVLVRTSILTRWPWTKRYNEDEFGTALPDTDVWAWSVLGRVERRLAETVSDHEVAERTRSHETAERVPPLDERLAAARRRVAEEAVRSQRLEEAERLARAAQAKADSNRTALGWIAAIAVSFVLLAQCPDSRGGAEADCDNEGGRIVCY